MKKSDFVIVGGVACGPKTAATLARRLPGASITLFQKEQFMSYASCGMPWLASGDLMGYELLLQTPYGVIRDPEFFDSSKGFTAVTGAEVLSIDRERKCISVRLSDGTVEEHEYGKLVLATGATARQAPFEIPDSPLVGTFHSLDDAINFRSMAETGKVGEAVIVGAGFIGIELCEALSELWGIEETLIERENQVLPYVLDSDMARLVERELRRHDVTVKIGTTVERVYLAESGRPVVVMSGGEEVESDFVFLCMGVTPNTGLAKEAGLELGASGGILVNSHMRTSDENIYAGGDCVESVRQLTDENFYIPMGSLANRHGRVIAENLAGFDMTYKGALGAFVVKAFDLNIGTVGLTDTAATRGHLDHSAVWGTYSDRPDYMPEHANVSLKMIYEKNSERLLGLQAVGKGDINRRIDVFSSFLLHRSAIDDLINHEHGYAPPYAEALDPLYHLATQARAQKRGIVFEGPDAYFHVEHGSILLDVREADEAARIPLPSESLPEDWERLAIPLGHLAKGLGSLPRNKHIKVICERGTRSYQAAVILRKAGFENVSIIGGGLLAIM